MQALSSEVRQAIESLRLPNRFQNKLIKDVDYILSKKLPDLLEIRLFGSIATGRYRASSDIDLLLVTDGNVENRTLRGEIHETLDEPLNGVVTDVVFYSIESFVNGTDTFSKELQSQSILIWSKEEEA